MPAKKLPDEETLRRLYWDEQKTAMEIAALYEATSHSVIGRMRRLGIPRRSKTDGLTLAYAKGYHHKRLPATGSAIKRTLRCSACGWVWAYDGPHLHTACPHCGAAKEARSRPGAAKLPKFKEWVARNPKPPGAGRVSYQRLRRSVLLLVGRGVVACVRCGCDRAELIEVNHKNGGGSREFRETGGSSSRFYWSIVKLERPLDDLELCCKVCNALHALELTHGPLPYRVIYERPGSGGAG